MVAFSVDTTLTRSPSVAASFLRRGALVAFPTETVYGLGADAFQKGAVEAIFEAKGRPADNPLIVHVARHSQVSQVVSDVPPVADVLIEQFTPGPLTLILPKHPSIPSVVTAGLDTVGVRIPRHEVGRPFLRMADTPVAAPSANRSGRPSPTSWEAVEEDLGGRIACILQGGRTEAGVESTVLDCTVDPPVILRPGAVSLEALRDAVATIEVGGDADGEEGPRSPGTRHRHYAPAADVRVIDDPMEVRAASEAGYIGLDAPANVDNLLRHCVLPDVEHYAREVFHFFRECDRAGCSVVYAQRVPSEGIGRALNDRLDRAAAR